MLENALLCRIAIAFGGISTLAWVFSAGDLVDWGRNGVGKESGKWRGLEDPGVEFPLEGRLVLMFADNFCARTGRSSTGKI